MTIQNTGATPIPAPCSVVLAGVSPKATQFNKSGVTDYFASANSPYLDVSLVPLAPGASLTFNLELRVSDNGTVSWHENILADPGVR